MRFPYLLARAAEVSIACFDAIAAFNKFMALCRLALCRLRDADSDGDCLWWGYRRRSRSGRYV